MNTILSLDTHTSKHSVCYIHCFIELRFSCKCSGIQCRCLILFNICVSNLCHRNRFVDVQAEHIFDWRQCQGQRADASDDQQTWQNRSSTTETHKVRYVCIRLLNWPFQYCIGPFCSACCRPAVIPPIATTIRSEGWTISRRPLAARMVLHIIQTVYKNRYHAVVFCRC